MASQRISRSDRALTSSLRGPAANATGREVHLGSRAAQAGIVSEVEIMSQMCTLE